MWILIARAPRPDAPYWRGRRTLALVDAVFWPILVATGLNHLALSAGLAGSVLMAACVLIGARRVSIAMWDVGQYRFITARIAVPLVVLLAIGAVLKLAA